jgi:hypothetical protein
MDFFTGIAGVYRNVFRNISGYLYIGFSTRYYFSGEADNNQEKAVYTSVGNLPVCDHFFIDYV